MELISVVLTAISMKTWETDLKFAELVPRTSLVRGRVGLFVDEIRVIRFPTTFVDQYISYIDRKVDQITTWCKVDQNLTFVGQNIKSQSLVYS